MQDADTELKAVTEDLRELLSKVDAKVELPHPAAPLPAWHANGAALLGLAVAPYTVGLKRLTVASPQVMPGLGLEGEFEVHADEEAA